MRLSSAFPFAPENTWPDDREVLFSMLPPQPRAWSLSETYMEHVSWAFTPLAREDMVDVLTLIYKSAKRREQTEASEITPHKFAVLYMILSLGALTDLTIPPFNDEAKRYYHLARAALSMRSVFILPDISTIQAVSLLAMYDHLSDRPAAFDSPWFLISLACKLAQSVRTPSYVSQIADDHAAPHQIGLRTLI